DTPCARGRAGSAADAEGVRSLRLYGAPSEPGHHAPHAARSGLGRRLAGAAGIPARFHGAAAEEAGARSVEPEASGDRAVGGLPLQPERLTPAVHPGRAAAARLRRP